MGPRRKVQKSLNQCQGKTIVEGKNRDEAISSYNVTTANISHYLGSFMQTL